MFPVALIPAFDAERTIGDVVRDVVRLWPREAGRPPLFVVDDGSRDRTAEVAAEAGALVLRHPANRGKGAALRTGLRAAIDAGFDDVVTLDADGQHPAEEALRVARFEAVPGTIVLGVRALRAAGAPRANQLSNRISNAWLSLFSGQSLADTQCGLRRYPAREVLALEPRDDGYAFEAEVLLLAAKARMPIAQMPIRVLYDLPLRTTHFDAVRDPTRIIARVLRTVARRAPR